MWCRISIFLKVRRLKHAAREGREFVDVLNLQEFLRIDDNKVELFSFLATCVTALDTGKQIISTHHAEVLCTHSQDTSGLVPCTHEEANTRILLHLEML